MQFEEVAHFLARKGGAFTIWFGAGASIASTRGATPSWKEVLQGLRPDDLEIDDSKDIPDQLESIANRIGNASLKLGLRKMLIDSIATDKLDLDVMEAQAIIAQRAATLVSFNLEEISAFPFVMARGKGSFVSRTFSERVLHEPPPPFETGVGATGFPVFFPHGLLNRGRTVLTRSEYERLMSGIAMETAVHLAIGGNLIILGMSLNDAYLRTALMRHRRWLQDVFWFDSNFEHNQHNEWARVARVYTVKVPHERIWRELAEAFVDADDSGLLSIKRTQVREILPSVMVSVVSATQGIRDTFAKHFLEQSRIASPAELAELTRFYENAGVPLAREFGSVLDLASGSVPRI